MDVIVGSQGFIASHYIDSTYKVNNVHYKVPSLRFMLDIILGIEIVDLDKVQNILWLAGKSFPFNTTSKNDPGYVYDLETLTSFLNFLIENKWKGRFIFLSSGGCVYAQSHNALTEGSKLQPNNLYGRLKVEQENLIINSGITFTILRVSNVFGHRVRVTSGQDVINNWIRNFKVGNICQVYGSLETFRDYINVIDVVSAISLATTKSDSSHILNIGSGVILSTKELVEIFDKCTSREIKFDFKGARSIDRFGYVMDISLASSVLGWAPKYSDKISISQFIKKELDT